MGDNGRAAGLQAATRFVKGFLWLAADNLQRNVKRYKVRSKCPGWCRLNCAVDWIGLHYCCLVVRGTKDTYIYPYVAIWPGKPVQAGIVLQR